jgi:hypothetical protein
MLSLRSVDVESRLNAATNLGVRKGELVIWRTAISTPSPYTHVALVCLLIILENRTILPGRG